MNYRRVLGISFVSIGFILTLTSFTITGGVIGSNSIYSIRIAGVLFFLVGVLLNFLANVKERTAPAPSSIDDIIEASNQSRNRQNHVPANVSYHYGKPLLLADTCGLTSMYDTAPEVIRHITPNNPIHIIGDVASELQNLASPKRRQREGYGGHFRQSTRLRDYLQGQGASEEKIKSIPTDRIKYDKEEQEYLAKIWDQVYGTEVGRKLIQRSGKTVHGALLDVADGKIASLAKQAAYIGSEVFVITEDKLLRIILEKINDDLTSQEKPPILYGCINDWQEVTGKNLSHQQVA